MGTRSDDSLIAEELIAVRQARLKSWPSPQDYNEAMQIPQSNLRDSELQAGEATCNSLGIPRPVSGMFASVYQVKCAQKDWAVRCFLHEISDQQERYERIEERLNELALPFIVPFDFEQKGILVHGAWYPVLKMEWCSGKTLDLYVAELIESDQMRQLYAGAAGPVTPEQSECSQRLLELANEWAGVIAKMQQHGIAHGDLQHGNILVEGGKLKLVDYDGMFVPGLEGRGSSELGHRNYQHPARKPEDFHADLDNFSSWVVYLSLKCLAEDIGLWSNAAGRESLLFTREDFLKPHKSHLFNKLVSHPSLEVRTSAQWLRHLLTLPLHLVPRLDPHLDLSLQNFPRATSEGWWEQDQLEKPTVPDTEPPRVSPAQVPPLAAQPQAVAASAPGTFFRPELIGMFIASCLALLVIGGLWIICSSPAPTPVAAVSSSHAAHPDKYVENALFRKGDSAYERGDFAQAQSSFAAFLRMVPASATERSVLDARVRLGQIYSQNGQFSNAWETFVPALDALKNHAELTSAEKSIAYDLSIRLAAISLDIGDEDSRESFTRDARRFYDSSWTNYSKSDQIREETIQADICRAQDRLGWFSGAVVPASAKTAFRQACQRLCFSNGITHDYRAAFVSFAEVRAATPESNRADFYIAAVDEELGFSYVAAGLPDRAIAALQNAAKDLRYLISNTSESSLPMKDLKPRLGAVLVKLAVALEHRAKLAAEGKEKDLEAAKIAFSEAINLLGEESAVKAKQRTEFPGPSESPYKGSYEQFSSDSFYAKKTGT